MTIRAVGLNKRRAQLVACSLFVLGACGDANDGAHASATTAADAGKVDDAGTMADKSAPKPRVWSGTQNCRGFRTDGQSIPEKTITTKIASYSQTQTSVKITGVNLTAYPDYQCSNLSFTSVVTSHDTIVTAFEMDTPSTCKAPNGQLLSVGPLNNGNLLDESGSGIPNLSSLSFDIGLSDMPDDGEVPSVSIDCSFDLMDGS